MKYYRQRIAILALLVAFTLPAALLYGETEIVHGADSTFRTDTLGICWGIVKDATSGALQVVTRIQLLEQEKNSFRSFAVKAFHPFTETSEWIAPRQSLENTNDIISPREDFKRLGGRQIFFYENATGPENQPADLIVEYLGIPDTSPQFAGYDELEDYFGIAFDRLIRP